MNTYSRIIAGAMNWGVWGKKLSTLQMQELIEYCILNRITTFDHADIYGDYTTEQDFGKAWKDLNIERESVQIITKCGIQYKAENRDNKVKHYDTSKEYIIWSAENSLKLLNTDYVDLLLIHRPSPLMHPNEIAEAVAKLKQDGKIKAFGVSNFTVSQMQLLKDKVDVEANQIEFSLTEHSAMHDGTLDEMIKQNIIPMSWSPLGEVFKKDSEQTRRIHRKLGELMGKYNATEDQLLLSWIMKHPSNVHPVVGTTNKERLTNAIKATEIELSLEDWFEILVAAQGHKVP